MAIIAISEGKLRFDAMSTLYAQIQCLEKDLANDDTALNWFNLLSPVSPNGFKNTASEVPSTPLALMPHLKNNFQGK